MTTRLERLRKNLELEEQHSVHIPNDFTNRVTELVKKRRSGCSRVVITTKKPRFSSIWSSESLTCCDEKMTEVKVFYPNKGEYSRTEYMASPEYVCMRCLRCVGPCDYDSPPF